MHFRRAIALSALLLVGPAVAHAQNPMMAAVKAQHEQVKGYLLKNSIADELPLAIRAASRGQVYLSPAISDSVLNTLMMPSEGPLPESPAELLTPREREVLQLIAEGHTNNAIAEILTISVKTVEKHRASLMSKLGVHDLPTLMRTSIKHGLIFLDK